MVFSSLSMLLFFLPGVLLMYALIWYVYGKRSTTVPNLFLCLASLCFYSWGAGTGQILVLLGLIGANYFVSYLLRTKGSGAVLAAGILLDVFVLFQL